VGEHELMRREWNMKAHDGSCRCAWELREREWIMCVITNYGGGDGLSWCARMMEAEMDDVGEHELMRRGWIVLVCMNDEGEDRLWRRTMYYVGAHGLYRRE